MSLKSYVWLGLSIGGIVGGIIGAWLDHGNALGAWSVLIGSVGSLVGIWLGYRAYNS